MYIERESQDKPLTPRGNTRIEANDLLTVYSARGAEPGLTDILEMSEDIREFWLRSRRRINSYQIVRLDPDISPGR